MASRVYKRFIPTLTCVFVALPSIAYAQPTHPHHFVPPGGWGALDLQIAHEYWGMDDAPDCATESMYFERTFQLGPNGEDRNGYATQPTEPGTDCIMHIWSSLDIMRECATVVHEFGHWLGYGHSPDPHDVMYPGVLWINVPGRCKHLYKLGHPNATLTEAKIAYFNDEPIEVFAVAS